jgi:hypothetical protein
MRPRAGRYFAAGWARWSLPSSCRIRVATPVKGLVIEAMEKTASRGMRVPADRSR